jgi:hypothetical protein
LFFIANLLLPFAGRCGVFRVVLMKPCNKRAIRPLVRLLRTSQKLPASDLHSGACEEDSGRDGFAVPRLLHVAHELECLRGFDDVKLAARSTGPQYFAAQFLAVRRILLLLELILQSFPSLLCKLCRLKKMFP